MQVLFLYLERVKPEREMKLSELRRREDIDGHLEGMLARCEDSNGERVELYEHPFFSVLVGRGFCREGRKFLARQYRHSPVMVRRLGQAAAVDMMSSGVLFERMLRRSCSVKCEGDLTKRMWQPGNQRVRMYDFGGRTIRTWTKEGFSEEGLKREVSLRKAYSGKYEWMLPVRDVAGVGCLCMEEGLLDAYGLVREPASRRRAWGERKAAEILGEVHSIEHREVRGSEYVEEKREAYKKAKAGMHARYGGVSFELVDACMSKAFDVVSRERRVDVSLTHGDFQPGNVLISSEGGDGMWLIDWEDAAVRASVYDAMTWHLKSRRPEGLRERVKSFMGDDEGSVFELGCGKEVGVSLWVIEEWIWLFETSVREGVERLPEGLVVHFRELSKG